MQNGWIWASGFLTGAAWSFCNFYFLFQLIRMGFAGKNNSRNKILGMLVVKFPVLYVAGFYILRSRFFPVISIVAGFSAYFLVLCGLWAWFASSKSLLIKESA